MWGPNQRVLGIQRDLTARLAQGPVDAAGLARVMQGIGSHDLRAQLFFRDILLRLQRPGAPPLSDAARQALARVASWNGDVYFPFGADATTVLDPGATVFGRWFTDLEDAVLRPVFEPAAPTPWSVDSFDDATTGAADGGRDEFFDNLTPVVLHAVESTPSIPLHLDWLPASATGTTHDQRVDSAVGRRVERAVSELVVDLQDRGPVAVAGPDAHHDVHVRERGRSATSALREPRRLRPARRLPGAGRGRDLGRRRHTGGRAAAATPRHGGGDGPAVVIVLGAGLFLRRLRRRRLTT